ncbi:hypothetical protein [Serratia aquatilis]|uniref:Uncharacterized protein n=1 Tax=Serratia aquatilis TaxID=1737515 RepID=A0ABV6EEA5_9GAMM
METVSKIMLNEIWKSLVHNPAPLEQITLCGEGALASVFPVSELATACWGAAGLACAHHST